MPKTYYYKMIDWWIMTNIVVNVFIFIFHIYLDNWIKTRQKVLDMRADSVAANLAKKNNSQEMLKLPSLREIKKAEKICPVLKRAREINFNAMAALTVIFLIFNLIYWYIALSHYYEKRVFDGGIEVNED